MDLDDIKYWVSNAHETTQGYFDEIDVMADVVDITKERMSDCLAELEAHQGSDWYYPLTQEVIRLQAVLDSLALLRILTKLKP